MNNYHQAMLIYIEIWSYVIMRGSSTFYRFQGIQAVGGLHEVFRLMEEGGRLNIKLVLYIVHIYYGLLDFFMCLNKTLILQCIGVF